MVPILTPRPSIYFRGLQVTQSLAYGLYMSVSSNLRYQVKTPDDIASPRPSFSLHDCPHFRRNGPFGAFAAASSGCAGGLWPIAALYRGRRAA